MGLIPFCSAVQAQRHLTSASGVSTLGNASCLLGMSVSNHAASGL